MSTCCLELLVEQRILDSSYSERIVSDMRDEIHLAFSATKLSEKFGDEDRNATISALLDNMELG